MSEPQNSSQPPSGGSVNPDYYVQWKPPLIPPGQGRRVVRIAIAVLAVALVFMGAVTLWRSNLIALPGGRGDIMGRVAAPTGGAVVFVLPNPTEIPVAADGSFTVPNVPAGRQMLYVALAGMAWEVPVEVPNQGSVDVGVITVEVTAEPAQ
ncbi:hypothetical protein [uncultured Chloroflexus sp.]|uniref:hypothetical protein n=1 Tax=uncultured Chloroflexus sp. TaxID=214040 RepID=UPI002631ED80|nr:hypothetical protein [uncultured Chloroflexus sp.]